MDNFDQNRSPTFDSGELKNVNIWSMYLLIAVIKLQNKSFKSIFTGLFLKLCVGLQYLYNNHNQRKVTPAYKKLQYARLIELPVLEKNKISCQDISLL